LDQLHAACEDLESEIVTLREQKENYLNQLLDTRHKLIQQDYTVENQKKALIDTRKTLERYEKENKALRQLVGLWASE
jgi:chromosome segregation ATPase